MPAAGETSSGTVDDLEPAVADYTTRAGAAQLAASIRQFWSSLGYDVLVWVEPTRAAGWCLRSNLRSGLPPPAAA